jgi:protein-disulfide isomerase
VNEHIKAKYTADPASKLCHISDYFNCGASISSRFSEVFGSPLAAFGIITQLVIIFFALKALLLDKPQTRSSSAAVSLGVIFFSALMSLIMASISLFIVKSLCPFCTGAYVLSFVALISGWVLFKPMIHSWSADVLKKLFLSGVVIVAAGFVTGKIIVNRYYDKDTQDLMGALIQDWKDQPVKDVSKVVAPIKIGPDSAKMKIVEFADFLCGHCKAAYPKIHTFMQTNKDVQLIFQTWPLDGCKGSTPGRPCQLAIASYCANLQSKGAEGMEYLFDSQQVFYETTDLEKELQLMADFTKMDGKTFLACFKDPNSLEMVKKQVEVGTALELKGTPSIFINNKFYQGAPEPAVLQVIQLTLE